MWAIYQTGEPRGIAIRSTYQRLSESITDQRPVWIGRVNYIDYDSDIVPTGNIYYPHICKRKSFEHEREIRAFYATNPFVLIEPDGYELAPIGPPGIPIAVDLDRLIEAVYVSPKAEKWFVGVIQDVLEKYGRTWPVRHSSLDNDPVR